MLLTAKGSPASFLRIQSMERWENQLLKIGHFYFVILTQPSTTTVLKSGYKMLIISAIETFEREIAKKLSHLRKKKVLSRLKTMPIGEKFSRYEEVIS